MPKNWYFYDATNGIETITIEGDGSTKTRITRKLANNELYDSDNIDEITNLDNTSIEEITVEYITTAKPDYSTYTISFNTDFITKTDEASNEAKGKLFASAWPTTIESDTGVADTGG